MKVSLLDYLEVFNIYLQTYSMSEYRYSEYHHYLAVYDLRADESPEMCPDYHHLKSYYPDIGDLAVGRCVPNETRLQYDGNLKNR